MKAYYLKFASEEEAKSVLWTAVTTTEFDPETEESVEVPALDEEGEPFFTPNFQNISVIGIMYNDDAVFGEDDEGMPTVVTPATAKEGWHVNVLALSGEDTTAIEEYSVEVATPSRVWGGQ
jgi:outer membrane protein assembly factor BamB